MLPLHLPLDKNELRFILQGIKALQAETVQCKNIMLVRMYPGDDNARSIIEYYDRRTVELHNIEIKILGVIRASG